MVFEQRFFAGLLLLVLGTPVSTSLFGVSSGGEKRFEVPGKCEKPMIQYKKTHTESNKKQSSVRLIHEGS